MDQATNLKKRDEILKILSDAETAKVSTAEGGKSLKEGDSFLDLDALEKGVQSGPAAGSVGHVIPKSAVSESSWSAIVSLLK